MSYCNPPIATRFPVNRKDHTQKGPYLSALLRKFLEKKIKYEDPETQKMIKGTVKEAIVWRLILNGAQGDNEAIKEILNRIDGKVAEVIKHEESKEALMQEEIELIPPNGHDVPERLKPFLKN